ncbi:MAG: hypothetical protein ACHQF2_09960 [Flavobacteriales bacterium]
MKTKKYFLFALLVFLGVPAISQIPLNIPSKDERYAKKIEKSAARDEIKQVEASIKQLDVNISRRSELLTFANDEEAFKEFDGPYTKIKNGIPAITAKDPKWKVEEYNAKLEGFTKQYNDIRAEYAKTLRANQIVDTLYYRDRKTDYERDHLEFGSDYMCSGLDDAYDHYYSLKCPCADLYYKYYVHTLNIGDTRKILQELFTIKPNCLTKGFNYDKTSSIKRFKEAYLDGFAAFKQDEIKEVEKFIEKAEKLEPGSEFHLIGVLQMYKRKMEALVSIDPTETNFPATIKKIDESVARLRANQQKVNMVTPERAGKIIFTATDAKREEFEAAAKITTWEFGTRLNFRWFLDKSPAEYHTSLNSTESSIWAFRDAMDKHIVYVNGEKFYEGWFQSYDDIQKEYNSALTLRGSYDPSKGFGHDLVIKMLQDLAAGSYDIKIEVYIGNDNKEFTEKPVVTGECKLNITAAGISKLLSSDNFCAPQAGMVDAGLSAQMIALVKEQGWKEIPKKAIIMSKSWNIEKNKYTGVTVSRWVEASILSDREGQCIRQVVVFEQLHIGGTSFGALKFGGVGDQDDISCKCIR